MRWNAWAALVIAMLAGLLLWIFLLRGPAILDSDSSLILGQLLLGMGIVSIAGLIFSTPANAIRFTRSQSHSIIICGTVVVQIAALMMLWPALSSDLARYRLDGLTWLSGNSPYAVTPREVFSKSQIDALDRAVPMSDFHSIYPPVAQTVFIAARAVEMVAFGPAKLLSRPAPLAASRWRPTLADVSWVHHGLVLRTIMSAATIGCVLVLLRLLKHTDRTPWLAVLFAWNPLVVLETAGSGHVDIIGVLLLLVMLRMIQKQNFTLATLALCLACGVKPMAILLSPILIRQISELRDWKIAQRSIGIAALTLALVFVPILLVQHGYRGWIVQLNLTSHWVEINGVFHSLGHWLIGQTWMTSNSRVLVQLLTPLVAAGTLLWAILKRLPIEDAGYWLMLGPLLVAPAVFPCSILWPLCFVPVMCLSRGWTALTWSATAALVYAAWHQPAVFQVPGKLLVAEYLPVAIALAVELWDAWVDSPARGQADVPSISSHGLAA